MAEYEIDYLHEGSHRVAVIIAESPREAFEQLASIRENGVIGDEIIERIDAGLEIERREIQHG